MTRTPEELADLVEKLKVDYARGMSLKQIERKHDIAASYAGRLLKKAGVALRPPADVTPIRREGWGGLNRGQERSYADRLAKYKPGK